MEKEERLNSAKMPILKKKKAYTHMMFQIKENKESCQINAILYPVCILGKRKGKLHYCVSDKWKCG